MGKCSKDKRDVYFRLSKTDGYRARSAYKLLQINEAYRLLQQGVNRVVDLCAAPGSWSQVLVQKLAPGSFIVAVDLQTMAPIPGVTMLRGDITQSSTADLVIHHLDQQQAQLVLCDGAPDVTGMHDLDEVVQSQLLLSALKITTAILEPGGHFVSKMFYGENTGLLLAQLGLFFRSVELFKPPSSRASSAEHFVVCRDYHCPPGFQTLWLEPYFASGSQTAVYCPRDARSSMSEDCRRLVPFVALGDLSAYDYRQPARPGHRDLHA